MAAFLDNCRFVATAAGIADWTFASPAGGCQSPQAAGAVNGIRYKFRAETADLTQWEIAEGVYTAASISFARTSVLYNSLGTGTAPGQSGTGAKINFTAVPQVAIVGLKEDLLSIEEANGFTSTQQAQGRANLAAASTPANWTRTVLTGGAGTYVTKAGCRALLVRMIGGGGGGGGGGGTSGATGGGAGSQSSFGSSLLAAFGGASSMGGLASGGSASGGDFNVTGAFGMLGIGDGVGLTPSAFGGSGGGTAFGGGGAGGYPGINGISASAYGAGGGGGGGPNGVAGQGGSGGGAAGYCEKLIAGPVASYAFAVGAGGGGGPGSGGLPGGNGGPGLIIVEEYY
jgi:hypothetical protein